MSDNYIDIGDLQVDTIVGHPELEDLEITPTTEEQEFNHDESYGYDKVSVSAVDHTIDSNITAENIKSGIEILGVEGSVVELAGEEITINPSTSEQVITPSQNKNGITRATVNPVPLETKSITPSTSSQTITPGSGKMGISQVNVSAVDNTIDNNIQAGNIKKDTTILGITGTYEGLKGEEVEITPTTSQQVITPSEGKNGITKATVKAVSSSIDANITANNIKEGVSILGVNGNVVELKGETKTITPTTSSQTILPSTGKNGITSVSVNAVDHTIDNNIQAGNIKSGVSILGVQGNIESVNGEEITITPSSTQQVITPSEGKNAITKATVNPVPKLKPPAFSLQNRIHLNLLDLEDYLRKLDLSEITDFSQAFSSVSFDNVSSEDVLDLTMVDTSSGENFSQMLRGISVVKKINMSNWSFENATNLGNIFSHGTTAGGSLTQIMLPTQKQQLPKVQFLTGMFSQQAQLTGTIDLDFIDTNVDGRKLAYIENICQNCRKIQIVKMKNINIKLPYISVSSMFDNCYLLERIDLDNLDMSGYTGVAKMGFANCGRDLPSGTYTKVYVKNQDTQSYILGLNTIPSGWTTANVIIAGSEDDHRND